MPPVRPWANCKTWPAPSAAGTGATQGAANEAIAAAANSGKIAAGNIELVSAAAIKLNKAVGLEVADTIESFAELGREPVKASEKLNEKYNYLTASIYTQIEALEEQGKTLEAGAMAQKAYADAMIGRADEVMAILGYIEAAWKGIIDTAKHGWDAMLGVGRTVRHRPDCRASAENGARSRHLRRHV
jgi:phage-related minor tail protein